MSLQKWVSHCLKRQDILEGGMSKGEEPCPCKRGFFLLRVGVSLEEGVCPCGKEVCTCESGCVIVVVGVLSLREKECHCSVLAGGNKSFWEYSVLV